jgi:ubiquinone biosynthesis protein UbiJ
MPTALSHLENVLNHLLSLDKETQAQWGAFAGQSLAITLPAWQVAIVLLPTDKGIQLIQRADYDQTPTACIEGSPFSFLQLLQTQQHQGNAQQAFFRGDIALRGDIHFAQAISGLCQKIDIDWEEHLSQLTGDITAHRLSQFARGALRFKNTVKESLTTNISEYLLEEARLTPSKGELNAFYEDIETLRDDVDRLIARTSHHVA